MSFKPRVKGDTHSFGKGLVALIVGTLAVAVALVIFIILYIICNRRSRRSRERERAIATAAVAATATAPSSSAAQSSSISLMVQSHAYTFQELVEATGAFTEENLIGVGAFGYVHKGVLSDGTLVAVKQRKPGSSQGEPQFMAEVEILSRIHHTHIVSLLGYSVSDEHMMVVYGYVPNKTLDFHLHGDQNSILDWSSRMKIAIGIAKGLAYLHEECQRKIIHRDVKAANILLTDDFIAKIADFGLAKFSSDAEANICGDEFPGTFGYMAPEYATSGTFTEKSDVYSFGVILLELISGQKPLDATRSPIDIVKLASQFADCNGLIDPRLRMNYIADEINRMFACAKRCILDSDKNRPRMSQVVHFLEGDVSLDDLNEEKVPMPSRDSGSPEIQELME